MVQPALLMDQPDEAGKVAALTAYLQGFSIPGRDNRPRTDLTVRLQDGSLPAGVTLVPVPPPDAGRVTVTPLDGDDHPITSLPLRQRDFFGFAALRSFQAYIAANAIFPRKFLSTSFAPGDGKTIIYDNWWWLKNLPQNPYYQPEWYTQGPRHATYAQMLAHQVLSLLESPARSAAGSSTTPWDSATQQLGLTFLIGRLLRLYDDSASHDPLFDGLAADPAADLAVVPDLRPGEDWHAALAVGKERHFATPPGSAARTGPSLQGRP